MRTFVINLERRPDRKAQMENQLAAVGVDADWILAIDGHNTTSLPAGTLVSAGSFGCFMSHVRALDEFLEGNDDYALILEDDARFLNAVDWRSLLDSLPTAMQEQGLDFLQLGFISQFYRSNWRALLRTLILRDGLATRRLTPLADLRYLPNHARAGTHAYVASRKFAIHARLLNQPVWLPADSFYVALASAASVNGHLNMGCLHESLVEQESRRNGLSDHLDSDIG